MFDKTLPILFLFLEVLKIWSPIYYYIFTLTHNLAFYLQFRSPKKLEFQFDIDPIYYRPLMRIFLYTHYTFEHIFQDLSTEVPIIIKITREFSKSLLTVIK